MDRRPALATQTSLPPRRSLSGSYALQHGLRRAPVPSRLSNVRSFSQPVNLVDPISEAAAKSTDLGGSTAFLTSHDAITTSPDVTDVSEDDVERPAKRVKSSGHTFRSREGRDAEVDVDTVHEVRPGSPLPQLRKHFALPSRGVRRRSSRTAVQRASRRANGLEPPSIATRLPAPRHVADFFPWTGKHPEDVMNETVVKAGYYDKASGPNSTESNSAKPIIWPNLSQKNNMGLQTLSYLFTQVMEKRQAMGKCTAPSTFKPPPRVTVTDAKREAWLRDLSNPDVPLRKQSRTIPHGIRGKVLMEQCLGKEIPLPRAVWLAKCVGANELRAFRRKGVSGAAAASGESKWVRDWTVQVEQFLDSVIASCGTPLWQQRMDYAIKLATSFFSERLLERDHYLDWIVTSFARASVDRLPIWILFAQLYWRNITAFGRRGRQLAEAILNTLHRASTGAEHINGTLKERLTKLIAILAVTNRGCLIIPRTWTKYKHLLAAEALTASNEALGAPAQIILRRNIRLSGPFLKTPQNTRCALLELYTALDSVGLSIDVASLASLCLQKIPDESRLIFALLRWSASIYRTGQSRIYLASKLIVALQRRGINTDASVLEFLRIANTASIAVENIYRVIAELARAECFSVGRYLQWLMTSGALSASQDSGLAAGLLAALPVDALPPHLSTTRHMLMRRLGYDADQVLLVNQLQASVDVATKTSPSQTEKLVKAIESLSVSAKLEHARRVSLQAAASAKDHGFLVQSYCQVRDHLQQCGDLSALSLVTQAAMDTDDTSLLSTISDTLNLHAKAFAAIGCLQEMLDKVLERYCILRSQQALDRCFILCLTSLARRCPGREQIVRVLNNDLAICEQQTSMAVYSPASDNLVSMQAMQLDSDNDIDAVFLSGNTMDEQLMQRVFSRIVQRVGKPGRSYTHGTGKVCGWFKQLRALDTACFDQLTKNSLQACLGSTSESLTALKVIGALVASESISFERVLDLAAEANTTLAAVTAIRLLTSKNVMGDGFHPTEAFRFQVQQGICLDDCAAKVIPLLIVAMDDFQLDVDDDGLVNLLLNYSVWHGQEDYNKSTAIQPSTNFLANSHRMTRRLLGLSRVDEATDTELDPRSVIALADPLSVVQCSGALQLLANTDSLRGSEDDSSLQSAILEAIANGCEVWPQLLERAGKDTIRGIYSWAKEQVLSISVGGDASTLSDEDIKRYLDILDIAHHATDQEHDDSVIITLTEKLKILEGNLSNLEVDSVEDGDRKQFMSSLQTLLHLSILFCTNSAPDSDISKQSRADLLSALCALIIHPNLQIHRAILEYIYDVASAVADTLPLETLSSLARSSSASIVRDPRLASILGPSSSPDSWLALVTHPQPQSSSPQQRAALKQQQQQIPARQAPPSPSPLQQQASSPGPGLGLGLGKSPTRTDGRAVEQKFVPFPLRSWEIIADATPTVGDNDTSLSLGLFGARRV